MRRRLAVLLLGAASWAGAQTHRDVPYVPFGTERQRLDLYLPRSSAPLPLIIWIHGGGWLSGSKDNPLPLKLLPGAGYAIASVNYRYSSMAKFPAQIEDVKAAVRFLRASAKTYNLDPNRFVAWGASAGGHLAALLGTAGDKFDFGERTNVSSRVQGVIDYYGPTDFLAMDAHALAEAPMRHEAGNSPESQLIGGPVRENDLLVARANPVRYVTRDDPPFLIVHGDRDAVVPHHQSEVLEAALRRAGVRVRLHTVAGGGHGTGFEKDAEIVPLIEAFLKQALRGAK